MKYLYVARRFYSWQSLGVPVARGEKSIGCLPVYAKASDVLEDVSYFEIAVEEDGDDRRDDRQPDGG